MGGAREFFFSMAMQVPWLKYLLYKFRVPINKPLDYIRGTLMHMINHKRLSSPDDNKKMGNDLIDFMSSALTKGENRMGSKGP